MQKLIEGKKVKERRETLDYSLPSLERSAEDSVTQKNHRKVTGGEGSCLIIGITRL